METLREKIVALGRSKIEMPAGLEIGDERDLQAVLAIQKNRNMYYVRISNPKLGLAHQFGIGSDNEQYAQAQFIFHLDMIEKGEYFLSFAPPQFRPSGAEASIAAGYEEI